MCSLKRTFLVLISVLLCLGIVITGIGIWILLDERVGHFEAKDHLNVTKLLYNSSYVAITFGTAFLIMGTIGLFGVSLKKQALLCLFSVLLIIPIILSISAMGVAWFAAKDNRVKTLLEEELFEVWKDPTIFGNIESNLECCGVLDQYEYGGNPPNSCKEERTEFYYSKGCVDRLRQVAYVMASILTGFTIVIIALAIIAAILAMKIRRRVKEDSTDAAVPVRSDEIVFRAIPIE